MAEEQKYLDMLALREIKPTALRLMILRTMLGSGCAMSLLDITYALVTVDKSTVSRTLALFLEHHLIHSIDDGSGSLKYAVCSNECTCHVDDLHTHFYCEVCHRTFCLKTIGVPVVDLPAGFVTHSINYIVKGICDKCSAAGAVAGE